MKYITYCGDSAIPQVQPSYSSNAGTTIHNHAVLKIIDRESGSWNLFAYQRNIFLDVPCKIGPYHLPLLIRLNSAEQNFHQTCSGRYIESLVERIQARPQAFFDRNESSEMQYIARAALEYPFKKRK